MAVKENAADRRQREKLMREKELSGSARLSRTVLTVLFCLMLGAGAVFHVILPDREYSEAENRVLQAFPEFSLSSLVSGKYTSDITKYLSDQFPARDFFVTLKAASETLLLRGENGGVMISGDTLIARSDYPSRENLRVNSDAAKTFAAALEKSGIPTVTAIAGRSEDVAVSALPRLYGTSAQDMLWDDIASAFDGIDGTYLDLRSVIREKCESGESVMFRTDHHWNALGAYYAYRAIFDALPTDVTDGISPRERDEFTVECASETFYGTSYSKSGAAWVSPDTLELFRFDGDDTLTVTVADTGEVHTGLYYPEYLSVRDKYSVFLGENAGRLDITSGESRKTLVLVKDSFAQSVAPYLSADFDIVMIDPRYFSDPVYIAAIEADADAVVILMNADTLTSSAVLRALPRGTDR